MYISIREREQMQKQSDKFISKKLVECEARYSYGKATMGQLVKEKQYLKKYSEAMEKFLNSGS